MKCDKDTIRVLIIKSHMDIGGLESHIIRVFRELDKNKLQFDFFLEQSNGYHHSEIRKLGGIIYSPDRTERTSHPERLNKVLNANRYKAVIIFQDIGGNTKDLFIARKHNIQLVIYRTIKNCYGSLFRQLDVSISYFFSSLIIYDEDSPPKILKTCFQNRSLSVKNSLQISKYRFASSLRSDFRKKYNLEHSFVVGNVARFYSQKNHCFLLKVFKKFKSICPSAKLLLVGDGELRNNIVNKIEKYEISDDVILLGMRDDIPHILMAMDIFCLPSYDENTTNSILEAQTTGLYCLASNTITIKANVFGRVQYLDISDTQTWVDVMIEYYNKEEKYNRKIAADLMLERGYNVADISYAISKYIIDN